ncbi:MAG: ribonuclease R [Minwuia sp.]|uniref:ribonuclease R n=1 Tax=Minwuia sp. TaxID=2493630 RepID=UPI003A8A260C
MTDGPLPTKQQIRTLIDESGGTAGKREVARAFGIKGQDRIWLKRMMKEIEAERAVETKDKGRPPGRLPPVTVLTVIETTGDGMVLCRPTAWEAGVESPRIELDPDTVKGPAPKTGDQYLSRLLKRRDGYEARAMKRLEITPRTLTGVLQLGGKEAWVRPTDRKLKQEMRVHLGDLNGAEHGDLVLVESLPSRAMGPRLAKVVEVLGSFDSPKAISILAIQNHGIPDSFRPEALGEAAEALPVTEPGRRTDIRKIPLITIDPSDARDHDDAVWAEADDDPGNKGGFRILVAIADVAHYVRPGSALDKAAQERGVSTYFPDRVAPMLPEALSADLCSLMPNEIRPVMAVEMVIDSSGRKLRHKFFRALMRSAGNFAYETVQAAIEGRPTDEIGPLVEPVLKPLYGAFEALEKARSRRETLEIEMPERRAEIGEDGFIREILPRERLDAHKLIEEMMILANVCAAETLERRSQPCVYRIHEPPDPEKLRPLKEMLETLGIPFTVGETVRPKNFNHALRKARDTDAEAMVNEAVLRSQTPAYYGTDNKGHFGLALRRYAHFTSPIRRYADLLVHRALIDALKAGNDGLGGMPIKEIQDLAEQVSANERRAMLAERDAMDRFTAVFMQDRIGAQFSARISGITRAGVFVTLTETGASGLVPMRHLGSDFFEFDERTVSLVGRSTGAVFHLGQAVAVRLKEAAPVTGGLLFEMLNQPAAKPRRPQQGRPRNLPKRGGKPSLKNKGKRRR